MKAAFDERQGRWKTGGGWKRRASNEALVVMPEP